MWVARDKGMNGSEGRLRLFVKEKPARHIYYDKWTVLGGNAYGPMGECPPEYCIYIESNMFPNLKWEDEPIEIELVPKMMNAVQEKLAESVDNYFDYVGHVQDIHPYSKEQEQNYYNEMCWRWQDWNDIRYDHPSTWYLNFDDYVGNKK